MKKELIKRQRQMLFALADMVGDISNSELNKHIKQLKKLKKNKVPRINNKNDRIVEYNRKQS